MQIIFFSFHARCKNTQLCLRESRVHRLKMPQPEVKISETECGSSATIDSFSDDILLEVFKLLDVESLKNACLVCKNWNELIGSSACTMKRFQLNLKCGQPDVRGFHSKRKYLNIHVHADERFDGISEWISKFQTAQVKSFILRTGFNFAINEVLQILSEMPLLEFLMIQIFNIDLSSLEGSVNLERLKALTIDHHNCQVLKFISAKNVSKIKLTNNSLEPSTEDVDGLYEFLNQNENLKSLTLNKTGFNQIFSKNELNLQLASFEVEFNYKQLTLPEQFLKVFNEFLIVQSKTLIHLKIEFIKNMSLPLFKTIFRLKQLKTLSLDVSELPTNREFYLKAKPLNELDELVICTYFRSDDAAEGLLGNSPNVTSITFKEYIGDEINLVAVYNQNLTKLDLKALRNPVNENLTYKLLKSLSVGEIMDTDNLLSLITKSPAIESLTVEWVHEEKVTEHFIEVLLQQRSLFHLNFTGDYEVLKHIFNNLKNNFGHLKSTEFTIYDKNENFEAAIARVRLNFPDHPSQWVVEDQEKRFEEAHTVALERTYVS